jgi:hypothetical protein
MLPIGAAILGGLAQNAPAIGTLAGQGIASAVDPAAKAYRQQMKKDITALKQGKLGLSEAEKRTMLAGTQRALQAQTAGAEANLRRSAAAMGGFGRSGAQQAALGQMGAAQQEKLTETMGRIDQQSQDVAQQRFASVMQRLADKRREAMETGREAGQVAGKTIKDISEQFMPAKKAFDEKQVRDAEEEAKKRAALDAMQTVPAANVPG